MSLRISATQAILAVAQLILLSAAPGNTAMAQPPGLIIAATEFPDDLSAHGRYLLKELDWVAELESQLQQSRSVVLLTRDAKNIQAILQEKNLAESSLSQGGDSADFGLAVADSILRPVVSRFDVRTRYQSIELLDGVYERTDSLSIEYTIRVFAPNGVERFHKDVAMQYTFPAIEETGPEKRTGRFRAAGSLRARSDALVAELVDAITLRINPMTVIDVQARYFVIDRGRAGGIAAGDRFQVYAPSRVVEHAVNKRKIRIPGKRIGEARITEVHDDIAFASLVAGAGEKPTIETGYTLRAAGKRP